MKEIMNWTKFQWWRWIKWNNWGPTIKIKKSESYYDSITDSEKDGEIIVVVGKNAGATESTQEKYSGEQKSEKKMIFSEI